MNEADSRYAKRVAAQSRDGLNCYRDMMSRFGNGTTKEFHSWATNSAATTHAFATTVRPVILAAQSNA